MVAIFKIIDIVKKTRQGYQRPKELIQETSLGFVDGLFWLIVTALSLGIITSLVLGFGYDLGFFKFFGFLLVIPLAIVISIFQGIKKIINKLSDNLASRVSSVKNNAKRVITVEAEENTSHE